MNRHVLKLLAATFVALACGNAASAADMPIKAPVYKAPPAVVAYNWSGFYIGGNVGGAWDAGWENTFYGLTAASGVATTPFSDSGSGIVAGGQIGYNWQVSPRWVLGVEADLQWTNLDSGSRLAPPPVLPGFVIDPGSFVTQSRDVDWFGTVRGRVGYTWDRVMLYATGGFAYARVNYTAFSSFPVAGTVFPVSFRETQTGWTVGGGLEYAVAGNWSIKGEYLYVSLGDASASSNGIPNTAPQGAGYLWDKTDFHVARFGLNYRFGGKAVVAKY